MEIQQQPPTNPLKNVTLEQETEDIIKGDSYVLLVDNKGIKKFVDLKLKGSLKVKWRKKQLDLTPCLGLPFNTLFDLDADGKLQICTANDVGMAKDVLRLEDEEKGSDGIIDHGDGSLLNVVVEDSVDEERDNRNFFANDPNTQKLSHEGIAKMKEEGKEGQELIEEIAKQNQNFEQKTIFSQKKYMKRKMEKHIQRFRIVKTTLQNVAETIFTENSQNINHLRYDALSLLIHKANLSGAKNVMVIENAQGLLVASALARSEVSNVVALYTDEHKPSMNKYHCVELLNMPSTTLKRLTLASYTDVIEGPGAHASKYDSIVVTSDFEPAKIIKRLIPCVKSSGILTIFSPYLEPLTECFEIMFGSKNFVCVKIHDVFMRELQVLELRTHPLMNMHAYSGYILTGVKVTQPVSFINQPSAITKT